MALTQKTPFSLLNKDKHALIVTSRPTSFSQNAISKAEVQLVNQSSQRTKQRAKANQFQNKARSRYKSALQKQNLKRIQTYEKQRLDSLSKRSFYDAVAKEEREKAKKYQKTKDSSTTRPEVPNNRIENAKKSYQVIRGSTQQLNAWQKASKQLQQKKIQSFHDQQTQNQVKLRLNARIKQSQRKQLQAKQIGRFKAEINEQILQRRQKVKSLGSKNPDMQITDQGKGPSYDGSTNIVKLRQNLEIVLKDIFTKIKQDRAGEKPLEESGFETKRASEKLQELNLLIILNLEAQMKSLKSSKTMGRPLSLNKKTPLVIADYFRINHNIIQKNKQSLKCLTKKKTLNKFNTQGEIVANQKFLDVLSGRFVEYVPEQDRLRLHQFFQSPVKKYSPSQDSKQNQFAQMRKIRLKFMKKSWGQQKQRRKFETLIESLSQNLQKQIVRLNEKDEKLLNSIGVKVYGLNKLKRIKNKRHDASQKFKEIVHNVRKKLVHISNQYSKHSRLNSEPDISKMLPLKPLENKYSNSLFQLISMARRHSQTTIDIILSFLHKQPNLIYQYDIYRKTALNYFVQMKNIQMVRLLVRMGALVFISNHAEPPIKTAFRLKWREGIQAMIDELKQIK